MFASLRVGTFLLLLIVAGCATGIPEATTAPAQVDRATALLQQHGWQPVGVLGRDTIRVGDPAVVPDHVWELYLEVSRDVGLDFEPLRGRQVTLTRVELGGPKASVLSVGSEVVGAWIFADGGCVPGIFSLSASPADIEACQ